MIYDRHISTRRCYFYYAAFIFFSKVSNDFLPLNFDSPLVHPLTSFAFALLPDL